MKQRRIYNIIAGVFGIMGVIFLIVGGVVFLRQKSFVEGAAEVEGKISRIESSIDFDGETDYKAYVSYEYDGEEYKGVRLSEYSSSMYEGKKIELYVEREKPENVRVKSMIYLFPVIIAGMGGIFLIVAIIMIIISFKLKGVRKKLKETGMKIYAQVEKAIVETAYTSKGRHPYRLECVYYDERSGQPVICTSDIIWEEPDGYIGKYVSVYVDREDRSRYVVDLESLKTAL